MIKKDRERKGISQKEIARILNVSTATVSLALRNSEKVNEKTRVKVKETAELLNYRPCEIARSLILNKTWSIGLIIPCFSIIYYSELTDAIQKRFREQNYLIITLSADTPEKRKEAITVLLNRKVEGFILPKINPDELYWLKKEKAPFVLYDRPEDSDYTDYNFVCVDKFKGAYKATEHLIKTGYKKIGFLCEIRVDEPRKRGYIEALIDYGMKIEKEWIIPGAGYYKDGYNGAKEILKMKKRPEALVCLNDISAIGAIRAFQEENIKVPGDIAIIGFDNVKEGIYSLPLLTTVDQMVEKVADEITNLLIETIENNKKEKRQIIIEPELVIRESCGCEIKEKEGVTGKNNGGDEE
ncbi:MAG: LacI family transcriptional regulator [Candidatus Omnitrophica bacterium]|nr:LacI family transcriptional regulator [Candidatus Omnitrophota bacterium]